MRMRHGGGKVVRQLNERSAIRTSLAVFVAALLMGATAEAATIQLSASRGAGQTVAATLGEDVGEITPTPQGTLRWKGSWEEDDWAVNWDVELDDDPGVGVHLLNVANGGATTGNFNFEVSVPSAVVLPSGSLITASSALTIADANSNGGSVSAPTGGSIYKGKIAGVTQKTLFDDPFALVAPPNLAASQHQTGSGTSTVALNVGDEIAIHHSLTLTAGDAATANSTFFVVPEPSGMGLALLALAGLYCVRHAVCR